MENLLEFMDKVIELITAIIEVCIQTTDLLNGVNFDDSIMAQYLGYVRYIFGPVLWTMFTTVLLIPLGVTVWIWTLKGIEKIKALLPT